VCDFSIECIKHVGCYILIKKALFFCSSGSNLLWFTIVAWFSLLDVFNTDSFCQSLSEKQVCTQIWCFRDETFFSFFFCPVSLSHRYLMLWKSMYEAANITKTLKWCTVYLPIRCKWKLCLLATVDSQHIFIENHIV